MMLARVVLASASLLSLALAQGAKIAFTSVPAVVRAGDSYNITWGGGNGSVRPRATTQEKRMLTVY